MFWKKMKNIQVFNVILPDRNRSMGIIRQAAVEGSNETLANIKNAQEKFADTQEHFVSLVTLCSGETKHVFEKTPVTETRLENERFIELNKTSPNIIVFRFHITEWGDDNVFNGIDNVLDKLAQIYITPLKIKGVNKVYVIYSGEQKIFAQLPSASGLDDNGLDLFTDTIVTYLPDKHFDFDYDIDFEQIYNAKPSVEGIKITVIIGCKSCNNDI